MAAAAARFPRRRPAPAGAAAEHSRRARGGRRRTRSRAHACLLGQRRERGRAERPGPWLRNGRGYVLAVNLGIKPSVRKGPGRPSGYVTRSHHRYTRASDTARRLARRPGVCPRVRAGGRKQRTGWARAGGGANAPPALLRGGARDRELAWAPPAWRVTGRLPTYVTRVTRVTCYTHQ